MYQWRKLPFFESRETNDPFPEDYLKERLVSSTSGRGLVSFGAADGRIRMFERGMKLRSVFQAHSGSVIHIVQLVVRNPTFSPFFNPKISGFVRFSRSWYFILYSVIRNSIFISPVN